MHDLVIRNGIIYDGKGGKPFQGDLAIDGERIAQVGGKAGPGRREIDASGAIVTPGFVDIHTHFDGQLTWDPYLTPTSAHGVTTIVAGNCGVGFAPARPDRHDWLIDLMEGVEDIPGAALTEGIQWEWETFPEYLDAIGRRKFAMDVGTQIPHGPLRAYVMGERGTANEPAHEDDIRTMAALTREALEKGALGFSTSRVMIHKSKSGDLVPGTFATREELFGIAAGIRDAGHGVFQMTSIHESLEPEYAWIRELAEAYKVPVQFNLQQADPAPEQWKSILKMIEDAHARGLKIYAGMAGRPAGMLYSWDSSIHPFIAYPSWREIAGLSPEARLAKLGEAGFRSRMLSEKPRDLGERGNFITRSFHKFYVLGDPPQYEPDPSTSVAAMAQASGRAPDEVLYDLMMQKGGKELIYFPIFNYSNGNMDHLVKLMQSKATVLSLGDGGAHCGFICDSSLPTFMLTHWSRDRSRGEKVPLEFIIRRQTLDTAQSYGLNDRGVLAPGWKADVNVIDYQNLHLDAPFMIRDLPAQGKRMVQYARGYLATICNGVPVMIKGEHTGDLSGSLIRGPQPAPPA